MHANEKTCGRGDAVKRTFRRSGFSLVELLTVIFIIALLIGILVPSLNAARNAAKKTSSKSVLNSVGVGLEMFKNENGSDFPQSNGYPPSFVHPPLTAFTAQFGANEANEGKFPYLEGYPIVYGAQWLPAMLMGLDNQGLIKRSAVPRQTPPLAPERWYTPEAIREFCRRIGVNRMDSVVDIALLEHCLRDDLNRRASRVITRYAAARPTA